MEIAGYLREAADVNMASPVSEARLSAVVNKLMALGLENESPSSLKPEGRGNAES